MKNLFYLILFSIGLSCNAQVLPLRTYTQIPQNAHLKDTNNELQSYVGTWVSTWESKTFYLYVARVEDNYNTTLKYYADILVAKYKVLDANGNIIFDNTNLSNDNAKIKGSKFKKSVGKYSLGYVDGDLCGMMGFIQVNFTDSTKSQLNWKFNEGSNLIGPDCQYYNQPFPKPLPKTIVLTKQ